MKIGYPCVNEAMDCSAANTFRLASYLEARLVATVTANLACLHWLLEWNVAQGLLFFRMGSGLVPFGSHSINTFAWQTYLAAEFPEMGDYIRAHDVRVSFHPDQFVVLNSPSPAIVQRSIEELIYQGTLLDLMGLDGTAKLQIHVGGLYGERDLALDQFATVHATLPAAVRARVVGIDDRLFSLRDCLRLHQRTGVPILFDNFHHECLHHGEPMAEALRLAAATWHPTADGVPMMDYSSQVPGERKGKHTTDLADDLFRAFVGHLHGLNFDIILEIKNKEASALRAVAILRELGLSAPAPGLPSPPLTLPNSPSAPTKRPRKAAPSVV